MSAGEPAALAEIRGRERDLVRLSPAAIGGAPVAYVVALAGVVAAFSFLPFSLALAAGNGFPMSQGIYGLTGILLGPLAGGVASAVGALVGVMLAPHTAGLPWQSLSGGFLCAVIGAAVCGGPRRRLLRLAIVALVAVEAVLYWRLAVDGHGVRPDIFVEAYLAHGVGFLLFLLPTRNLFAHLIASPNLRHVAIGLFGATWIATSLMMFTESYLGYYIYNWGAPLFGYFIAIIPVEQLARSGIGAVVGTGVIAGLRAMAVVRPRGAAY